MRASSAYGTQVAGRYEMNPLLGGLYGDFGDCGSWRGDVTVIPSQIRFVTAGVAGYVGDLS